jgi:hypothetical protein
MSLSRSMPGKLRMLCLLTLFHILGSVFAPSGVLGLGVEVANNILVTQGEA